MVFSEENEDFCQKNNEEDVNKRLLDAAEEIFSSKGFEGASIRDITKAANCNVAAVNYHFGNKEHLYRAIFKRHLRQMRDNHINTINKTMSEQNGTVTLENLLMSFAKAFIEPLVGKSENRRFITLMSREMFDMNLPANFFYEEMMLPVQNVMTDAMRKICPGISDEAAGLSLMSIVGQLVHIVRLTDFVERGGMSSIPFDTNQMIEHVVNFSAAGIEAVVEKSKNFQRL